MQVLIKPVPKTRWHGKEGKESFARPTSFSPLYSVESGGYATGLTEEETVEYSKKLGVNLSPVYQLEVPHEYWDSNAAVIKLPNHTMSLFTERALDFVKWKNCKASKLVANSLKEWDEGLWPEATHIIYDEKEEVEIKAGKVQLYQKCIVVLSKMSTEEKTNMVALLSTKSAAGRSVDFLDVELNSLLTLENKDSAENLELFVKYASMDKAEVTTRAKIMEAVFAGVISKEGHTHLYMGERLGHDYEATVSYFQDPGNQAIKVAVFEKLNKKIA